MKKYLFMALAAFAFVSCSSDFEANEGAVKGAKGERINYAVYSGAASRGDTIGLDALKGGTGGFAVWATNTAGTQQTFTDTVTWVDTKWVGNAPRYWTGSDIAFCFVAPVGILSVDTVISNKNTLAGTCTYTQPTNVAHQKDILYGNVTQSSGVVPVNFSHAMSRITFAVKPGDGISGAGIVITKLSITGTFNTSGTMNFKAASAGSFWSSTSSGSVTYKLTTLSSSATNTEAFTPILASGQDMFIIPGNASSLQINVTYNSGIEKTIALDDQTFEIGQYYQINMTIGADKITYNVNVTPWGETPTGVS